MQIGEFYMRLSREDLTMREHGFQNKIIYLDYSSNTIRSYQSSLNNHSAIVTTFLKIWTPGLEMMI
jgi:hypothetical protein